jgi:hypothetical protein
MARFHPSPYFACEIKLTKKCLILPLSCGRRARRPAGVGAKRIGWQNGRHVARSSHSAIAEDHETVETRLRNRECPRAVTGFGTPPESIGGTAPHRPRTHIPGDTFPVQLPGAARHKARSRPAERPTNRLQSLSDRRSEGLRRIFPLESYSSERKARRLVCPAQQVPATHHSAIKAFGSGPAGLK